MPKLTDFFSEFVAALRQQLEADNKRWGDTWLRRPVEGQEDRAFARFRDYEDQFHHGGVPVPWMKIAGEALIAWVREQHPELFATQRGP